MLAMTVAGVAEAAPVDGRRAAEVANHFWNVTLGMKDAVQQVEWTYGDVAYLYAAAGGGWVMVPDDDVARPILAYSTSSHLDTGHLPAATVGFLNISDKR